MDRCPRCWTRLMFIGIISKREWARWLECSHCGWYVKADAHGTILYAGNDVPAPSAFKVAHD